MPDREGATGRGRAASGSSNRKTSADIERDIKHTRAEMDETVHEIQERLRPERLKQHARETVRHTAKDTGRGMLETIKDNPVPSLIAGLSVGWLFAKGRQETSHHRDYASGYSGDRHPRAYQRDPQAQARAEYASTAPSSEAARSSESRTHAAKRQAGEMADRAQGQAQHLSERARQRTRQTTRRMDRMMDENPMALGAATFALGAVTGLLLPETRKENEWMGPARDQAVHKAQAKAGDTLQRAERVAERTAQEAKASAQHVKETAKDEAERQHLKSSGQ